MRYPWYLPRLKQWENRSENLDFCESSRLYLILESLCSTKVPTTNLHNFSCVKVLQIDFDSADWVSDAKNIAK